MTKGFTLIELMISIAIIGVVFGVVITSSAAIQKQSRDTQRQANLKTIQSALEQYKADSGFYPDTFVPPQALVYTGKTHLSPSPTDPTNSGIYKYIADPSGCTGTCVRYCLYANLEASGGSLAPQCTTLAGYNYSVNQP